MANKKFVGWLEEKIRKTINKYRLCNKKDKIAVAVSGGKDSTSCLYLLKKFGYDVFALHVDLGIGDYSKSCLDFLKKFCKQLKIKLHIIEMRKLFGSSMCYIRSSIQEKNKLSNCTICGIIKKWLLNKYARKLGATKLATGHNIDDEAETFLVNFFKGNPFLSVANGPAVGIIKDKKFITRIKPLFFCHNSETRKYMKLKKFDVVGKCPCAFGTFRLETRTFLEKQGDKIKENVVKNFLSILPEIRKKIVVGKLKYCKICEEPSRGEICKACQLVRFNE